MSDTGYDIEKNQLLDRMSRQSPYGQKEASFVSAAGGRPTAWVIKVISRYDYNVYNVRTVELGQPGTIPVVMGQEVLATNVAESFIQQGSLPAGTYAVMFRAGSKNVFYAPL